jgi:hypothetical protein
MIAFTALPAVAAGTPSTCAFPIEYNGWRDLAPLGPRTLGVDAAATAATEKMVTMLTIVACKSSNYRQVTLKVKKNVIMFHSLTIVVGFENNEASREHRFSSLLV